MPYIKQATRLCVIAFKIRPLQGAPSMISPKTLVTLICMAGAMTFSTAAFAATSTDYSNSGGTLTGSNAGLSLTGSTLIAVTTFPNGTSTTGDLGSVTFTTAGLTSGSLQMGGSFAAGGTFAVDGNGTDGIANGVLFSGSFSGPVTWTLTTLANGTHSYILTGVVSGTMGGANVDGVTVQLTINTGRGYFNGSTLISGGDTTFVSSVPEPTTLALFGTGALGLAATLRRKFLSANR